MTSARGRSRTDELAEDLVARGFGEGVEFYLDGRPTTLSSEYVALLRPSMASWQVVYCDMGRERMLLTTRRWRPARDRFVRELVTLVEGRRGLDSVDVAGLWEGEAL